MKFKIITILVLILFFVSSANSKLIPVSPPPPGNTTIIIIEGNGSKWIVVQPYLYNDTTSLFFNETKLNLTILAKIAGISPSANNWFIDGFTIQNITGLLQVNNSNIKPYRIADFDNDTFVTVEQINDEDQIRFNITGTEILRISRDETIPGELRLAGENNVSSGASPTIQMRGMDSKGTSVLMDQALYWQDNETATYNFDLNYGFGGMAMNLVANDLGVVDPLGMTYAMFSGSLHPESDLSYDLGNPLQRWNNLFIGMDAVISNNLTVENQLHVGNNVTADFYYGDGSKLTGISASGSVFGFDNDTLRNISNVISVNTTKYFLPQNISNQAFFVDGVNVSGVLTVDNNVVHVGNAVTNNNPTYPYDGEGIMSVWRTSNASDLVRAGLFVSEYNGTDNTATALVGLNAGVTVTGTGSLTASSSQGNTAGRYFWRGQSTSSQTTTRGTALSAQVANTNGGINTLTTGDVVNVETIAALTGTFGDVDAFQCPTATKSSTGTFDSYSCLEIPFNNQGTSTTPTSVNGINFVRDTGVGNRATLGIVFGSITASIGSSQAGVINITANNLTANADFKANNYYASNGSIGITASGTSCTITSITNGLITGAVCV